MEAGRPIMDLKIYRTSKPGSELSGKTFDRFQGYENLGGGFASPVNTGEGVGDLVFHI